MASQMSKEIASDAFLFWKDKKLLFLKYKMLYKATMSLLYNLHKYSQSTKNFFVLFKVSREMWKCGLSTTELNIMLIGKID